LKFILNQALKFRTLAKGEVLLANQAEEAAIFFSYFGEQIGLDKKINLDIFNITSVTGFYLSFHCNLSK
jgi:hypothetical protein